MAKRKPRISNVGSNEQTPDSGSDDSRRSGGFDPLLGYTAVGGAALTAGYIAGKASGVGARVVNKVKGREVWVHASPTSNLPKINPVVAPGGRPRYGKNESLTFGVRVGAKGTKPYMSEYSREISTKYSSSGAVAPAGKPVSVYVTTVPKKGIVGTEATGKWGISSMPQKVVSEINLVGKTPTQIQQSIVSAARRAGQSPRPEYSAVEKLRMELARRRFVKNNPVKKNVKRID